jgi:hypothetical protein
VFTHCADRKGGEDGKNFSGLILDCLRDLEPVERPRMRSLRPLVLKTRLFEEVVQLNTHEQQVSSGPDRPRRVVFAAEWRICCFG